MGLLDFGAILRHFPESLKEFFIKESEDELVAYHMIQEIGADNFRIEISIYDNDTIDLKRIAITKAYRRQGYGKRYWRKFIHNVKRGS